MTRTAKIRIGFAIAYLLAGGLGAAFFGKWGVGAAALLVTSLFLVILPKQN